MHIVYCLNDNYDVSNKEQINYLFMSLISLFETNPDPSMKVYLVYRHFNNDNRDAFLSFFKHKLDRIELVEFPKKFDKDIYQMMDYSYKTNEGVFMRLFLGEILPKDIDYFLHIDADTIINAPLQPIFDEIDGKHELYAVRELEHYAKQKERTLHLRKGTYFNAGIFLLDLKTMRKRLLSESLEVFRTRGGPGFVADQDAMNILFNDTVKMLPKICNYMVQRPFTKDAIIYHYAGNGQMVKNKHSPIDKRFKKIFWKYFDLTPWSGWRPKTKAKHIVLYSFNILFPVKFRNTVKTVLRI